MATVYVLHSRRERGIAVRMREQLQEFGCPAVLLNDQTSDLQSNIAPSDDPALLIVLVSPSALRSRQIPAIMQYFDVQTVGVIVSPIGDVSLPFNAIDAIQDTEIAVARFVEQVGQWFAQSGNGHPRKARVQFRLTAVVAIMVLAFAVVVFMGRGGADEPETERIGQGFEPLPRPSLTATPVPPPTTPVPAQTLVERVESATGESVTDTPEPSPVATVTALAALFNANPLAGNAPLNVTFENLSTGEIALYAWDFDADGVADSDLHDPAPVSFATSGAYPVTLTITGVNGERLSYTEWIEVYAVPVVAINSSADPVSSIAPLTPVTANFAANPGTGTAPLVVRFTNQSTGDILRYEWDFNGDGVVDSTERNPSIYTFAVPGQYEAVLRVIGADQAADEHRVTINVQIPVPPAPAASFSVTPLSGAAPLVVSFTNRSTGDITGYAWDFNGDGTVDSTSAQPSPYTFATSGTYVVSLVVIGPGGTSQPVAVSISVGEPEELPQPIAIFTTNPLFGTAPLDVTFTNHSIGNITSYVWDFDGDGIADSTDANPPSHTYATPGDYTVSLVVSGPGGSSEPEIETITVDEPEGRAAPIAVFTAAPSFGNAPLDVTFEDRSVGDITEYAWDFSGDGVTDSSDANPPSYLFTEPGEYTITLVVTGPGGASEPAEQVVSVVAANEALQPPTAAFTASPLDGSVPLEVSFTNQSVGEITGYAWDLNGDGNVDSTVPDPPPYTFYEAGVHSVSLVVTGPGGTSEPHTILITVEGETQPEPPSAVFAVTPDVGTAPLNIQLMNHSTGEISAYSWDFNGDGLPDSTDMNPQPYTYDVPGEYALSLVVTGPGGTSNHTVMIRVAPPLPPTADFSVSQTFGPSLLMVTFTNQSTGYITGYAWDFNGDGITDSVDANPQPYTYAQPGVYTVTLSVTGYDQQPVTVFETITVTEPEPIVARFQATPIEGIAPLTVTFVNQSTGAITTYAWDFNDDGAVDSHLEVPNPVGFQSPGMYPVSLTVSDVQGQQQVVTQTITVHAPPAPIAAFNAAPLSGPAPLTVTFANVSSGAIISYSWDFDGDGVVDDQTQSPPPVVYGHIGTFLPTLTVSDAWGQTSVQYIIITTNAP